MKRIVACLLLFITLWLTGTISAGTVRITTEVPQKLLGDANRDGEINIADATSIQRYLVGLNAKGFDETTADVTGAGVSILSATCIQRYLVGFANIYHIGSILN